METPKTTMNQMMVNILGELTDIIPKITISKLYGTKITKITNRMPISFTRCLISGLPDIKEELKINRMEILTAEYSTAIITSSQTTIM